MKMSAQFPHFALSILSVVALGCGPGLLDDSLLTGTAKQVDKDSESILIPEGLPDSDSSPMPKICPGEITASCDNSHLYASPHVLLASTEWLDAPAGFTHLELDVILGHYGDDNGTPFAIQLNFAQMMYPDDFDDLGAVMTFDSSDSNAEWIGAVSASQPLFDSTYRFLGVLKSGNKYQLIGIPRYIDSTRLIYLDMPVLQTDALLAGVAFPAGKTNLKDASLNIICVFGEGVFCFDGQKWTTELAPDDERHIVSMEVSEFQGHPVLYAVDEDGAIYTRLENSWSRLVIEDAPLLTTSGTNESSGLLTVAGDGILAHGDGNHLMFACDVSLDIAAFQYYRDSPEFLLFTRDGDLYSGEFDATDEPFICGPRYHIDDVIGFRPYGMNYYVLTPDSLWGTEDQNSIVVE
ncbi:MAG: hypothetical protein JXX14_20785, partial [Deltaproteobacteria bacterium]|nr:hypothetical protein [Deltaproteobacteria bacterium]